MRRLTLLVALLWVAMTALLVGTEGWCQNPGYTDIPDAALQDVRGANPGHPKIDFTRCACANVMVGQECFCEFAFDGSGCIKCDNSSIQNQVDNVILLPHGYTARFVLTCGAKKEGLCLSGACGGILINRGNCNNIVNYQEQSHP